jgi:hypothetical protein
VSLSHRRLRSATAALLVVLAALGQGAAAASAAGPPLLGASWASAVFSSSARLSAEIDPNGFFTTYHFDYLTEAGYEANVNAGKDGFTGAARIPSAFDANLGSGGKATVQQVLSNLQAGTAYRYRVVAKNSAPGTTTGPAQTFATQAIGGSLLPDGRSWEMVSPVDKNGGQVDPPGGLAAGGVLQAAAGGGAVTYGSSASFGSGAQGAPPASQYFAGRGAGGWSTQNISAPLFSDSFGTGAEGVPYRLFSGDLARGLLLNGRHCRGEATGCAVANPPPAGTDAPAGYQNYYLRESATASLSALLRSADVAELDLAPADFELAFAAASADLRHVVLSTCAALTPNAVEVPSGEGCDPGKANLYEYSPGTGLSLLNVLPAQSQGTPGAAIAAQSAAVSADGARVYWTDLSSGNLYLRDGGQTRQVDGLAGGGGTFETASADGSLAFYTKAGHLYRYDATAQSSTDLTPSGGVVGVLGASAAGSHVYYLTASGLFLRQGAIATKVAAAADASNYPPTSGTARVSADGAHLVFVSTTPLSGYDNTDLNTGTPDSQVYLYDAGFSTLTCASCNPTHGRPIGPSSIPGSIANGQGPEATASYKPRVLSADGRRVFFDSEDALASADTNADSDVYQWEAQGVGSCARAGGCVGLISSGRSEDGASFVDASADGSDAFFLTDGSLVAADPGSVDLYDARVGGGFPEPVSPIPCNGDACQVLPPEPTDPTLTTVLAGPGNPAVRYPGTGKRCKKGYVKRGAKCVKKSKKRKRGHEGRGR